MPIKIWYGFINAIVSDYDQLISFTNTSNVTNVVHQNISEEHNLYVWLILKYVFQFCIFLDMDNYVYQHISTLPVVLLSSVLGKRGNGVKRNIADVSDSNIAITSDDR